MKIHLLIIFTLLTIIPETSVLSQSRNLSAADLLAFDRISQLAPSPDGTLIAFTRSTLDIENNRRTSDIWLQPTDGSSPMQFTTGPAGGDSPHWAVDGESLFFVSSRSGSAQVWNSGLDGSGLAQVTDLPFDVSNLVVAPDGNSIAFTLDVFPECDSLECTARLLQKSEKSAGSGQLYGSLFVRHWRSFDDGRRSHLFVMPIAGGQPLDVTAGIDADVPSQPFGGAEEITFSPDSQSLIFTMKNVGHKEAWSVNFDLYVVPVDASKPPNSITPESDAWDTYPTFSPDGTRLAYLATERPGYESDRFRIVIKEWPSGSTRVLTEHWDHSPSELLWSPSGDKLFITAANGGQMSLFALDAASGTPRTLVESGTVAGVAVLGEKVFFLWDDLRTPPEIYYLPHGNDPKKISSLHDARLANLLLGDFEAFKFRGWNDEQVSAHVVKPVNVDEDSRGQYPVILLIHGGPQGSFGNHFQSFTNPHIWAGAGYATVMIDFHGSTGYGQAFSDSIRGDYGGKPYVDIMKGLDAVLARNPWMDGSRVAAVGRSFAGFMVNWIAGQAPDRFRCFVSHAGRLDERSAYLSTDELWFPEWDHEGSIWENPEGYERHNPINNIDQWQTPMLVVHGGRDYRVALAQSIATFTALQRRGIESKFLYFPDEGHSVSRPQNVVQWHSVVLDWFENCLD